MVRRPVFKADDAIYLTQNRGKPLGVAIGEAASRLVRTGVTELPAPRSSQFCTYVRRAPR
jgi:hypothetical protein